MNKKTVEMEHKRLEELLERVGVDSAKMLALQPVIDNLAWMRVKLDEAREQMQDLSLTCHYDNGGGQEGEREHPLFKAYVAMWRAYMVGFEKYSSYLPKDIQQAEEQAIQTDTLAQVISMKKKVKEG